MKCNKCGKDFSPKVWRIHVGVCNVLEEVETIKIEMTEEEIRDKAKENGIKGYWNKSIERLLKEIEGV